MAQAKKTPSPSCATSPSPSRSQNGGQPRTPPNKKGKAVVNSSPESQGSSKSPQRQRASPKKKKKKTARSPLQAIETEPTKGIEAVVGPKKSVGPASRKHGEASQAKRAKGAASPGRAPGGQVPTTSPASATPQSSKSSSSLTEEELDKIYPGAKKDRESEASKVGRILFEAFDEVGKTGGSRGLEASRWAPGASEPSSPSADEKDRTKNRQRKKSRSRGRSKKKVFSKSSPPSNDTPSHANSKLPAKNAKIMAPAHTVAPILDTPESKATEKDAAHVAQVLFDAFDELSKDSPRPGLEASRWAIIPTGKTPVRKESKPVNKTPAISKDEQTVKKVVSTNVANLNNTSAFMAAVRGRSTQAAKGASESVGNSKCLPDYVSSMACPDAFSVVSASKPEAPLEIQLQKSPEHKSDVASQSRTSVNKTLLTSTNSPASVTSSKGPTTGKEDREHLSFSSSGATPSPRSRPRVELRRVILSPIPESFASPSKVFSLIHGGRIESVRYFPQSKSAHVLFCDPAACQRYYDKYPNGIEVNVSGRKAIIFVDWHKEVDIVSSRLRESLRLGATRVVRAVGADLALNMKELADLPERLNFKLEKVIDVFDASSRVRAVTFRLSSIENAVRLRSYLIRQDDWQQANVQFGVDPCEVARGIHWD
ncbi:hypothetical protein CPC735_055230 [Coccidioides posadasii C735 delta SOWgp]|uniref:RRM domain-containing protein n=1 Tax=Coccidioides posadasii (strain C735) TaxID=222929 RepID=C5PI00_COCP7|nr:hypothetical protein CPC735_055230 [Coccidioides posadasii C735 delta SOWgp]EER24153.1 hypothetical protein CPC735_055230 [Coccidioides posadasii C735 delta SOWgp]|eukprot:XP_003066298.1 hypothetical protein CPC735_055230 [Coccidioides posadasii C735 delta SOWgp]